MRGRGGTVPYAGAMAGHRSTVYVSDYLWSQIDEIIGPDETLSGVLELELVRRLKGRPGCRHTAAQCAQCGERLSWPSAAPAADPAA